MPVTEAGGIALRSPENTAVLHVSRPFRGAAGAPPAALCTNIAQVQGVLTVDYNRQRVREICKEEITDWLFLNGFSKLAERIDACGTSFLHLKDQAGHQKYVRLYCKNEFCPKCGRKGSGIHKKRVRRAANRLLWPGILGYMVFTLPKEISRTVPPAKVLNDISREAWQNIKRNFKTPGAMARIHLLGDEPGCLHVHINVLFPLLSDDQMGRVPQEVLKKSKREWTRYINRKFKLKYDDTNIHYNFSTRKYKKLHRIMYVLRPIVTPEKFLTLPENERHGILSLKGWHNTRWYGKLSNGQYRKYLRSKGIDIDGLEAKIDDRLCPICGERYSIVGIIGENELPRNQLRWVDRDTLVDLATYLCIKTLRV